MYSDDSKKATLILEDNTTFEGFSFSFNNSVSGEVVFNTGMVGYPETFSDPSYYGQILVMTYPLVGNYGIPNINNEDELFNNLESKKPQISGLIVSEFSEKKQHWNSCKNLSEWLTENKIPALFDIDTRKLTKLLRESGTMLGQISFDNKKVKLFDPNEEDLISKVTIENEKRIGKGKKKVLLVDCGCKNSIAKSLANRGVEVIRVPWKSDFEKYDFDGVVFSNGPGNPEVYNELVEKAKIVLDLEKPTLGICLGHQIISRAVGAQTEKLKYGHRSQNQPVKEINTNKCFVTSQNHGFHVLTESLPGDWQPWFENLNDNTNEGIKHKSLPFMTVQFHPEASPGPVDTAFIFDEFLSKIK